MSQADGVASAWERALSKAFVFALTYVVTFACARSVAIAQSASPAPTPTSSPTPFKSITLGGSIDAGYTATGNADAARFTNGVPSRVFDASTGPFFDANGGRELAPANDFANALDLQNANVQLTLNGSVVSAKFEGSFGTDADAIASNGQSRSGANLTQSYLQVVEGPVTILAGKFSSLAGEEVIEAPRKHAVFAVVSLRLCGSLHAHGRARHVRI